MHACRVIRRVDRAVSAELRVGTIERVNRLKAFPTIYNKRICLGLGNMYNWHPTPAPPIEWLGI